MLKIAEGINLEELKKYGFEYMDKMMWKRYIRGNLVVFENVNLDPKAFEKEKLTPLINRCIYKKVNCEEKLAEETDGEVYDLIQAGIVVKE